MSEPTLDPDGRFFCPGELCLVVTRHEGRIIIAFDRGSSAAEYGIVIADVFKHFERAVGREFAASVFAMLYKELTKPTSGTTDITPVSGHP